MRLLERDANGRLNLHEYTGSRLPAYAILSHTWAIDNSQEVTLRDIEAGTADSKAGYKKIIFCADKAAADGLRWFWIDTCCIDKKNAVELAEAINSMFRWYRMAARCYVYLSDVSVSAVKGPQAQSGVGWEDSFRRSRWFSRGWTLQELVAPTLVDFFSADGERLGTKTGLEALLHDITGIAKNALRGDALSDFSIEERKSWAKHRHTKREEDHVYSLLGIFDVSMPLIYGEGRDKALRRLEDEIHRFSSGFDFEQFTVVIDLSTMPEPAQFVARQWELAEMHKLLWGHATQSAVVLHGLGGIGKSQLALEYVRRNKEKYTAVFWLNADNLDSLKLSFRDVAQQILISHPSTSMFTNLDLEGELWGVVKAVKMWLSLGNNRRWLVIYDNFDNPRAPGNIDPSTINISYFLPTADHGSVIITTRSSQVTNGRRIHVLKLHDINDALEILSSTSGRKEVRSDPAARELAEKLDGLPLALSTAGVYLEHVTTSFSAYLRLWNVSWLGLQRTSPHLRSYADRSLYTTWQITFDRIKQQNPMSAKLLTLWGYFDRQDIWFELLQHAKAADDEWIHILAKEELKFNEAVRLLCDYGLVDLQWSFSQADRFGTYSMHCCVHKWTVCVLNQERDDKLARLAMACIASKVPDPADKDWWLLQRRLLQHATVSQQLIEDRKVGTKGMEWALNSLGNLYANQNKLTEAEQMYSRALQGMEDALGPKHSSVLAIVGNLGSLLY